MFEPTAFDNPYTEQQVSLWTCNEDTPLQELPDSSELGMGRPLTLDAKLNMPLDWIHQRPWFVGASPAETQEKIKKVLFPFIYFVTNPVHAFFGELAFMILMSLGGIARIRYTDKYYWPDDDDSDEYDYSDSDIWEEDEEAEDEGTSTQSMRTRLTTVAPTRTPAYTPFTFLTPCPAFAHYPNFGTQVQILDTPMAMANTKSFLADLAITRLITKAFKGTDHQSTNIGVEKTMTDSNEKDRSSSPPEITKPKVARPKKPLTMRVALSDSLSVIAEDTFHDADLGWLIADINKGRSREHWLNGKRVIQLKERQEIILPSWRQIVSFYQSRPPIARAKNMVTVVDSIQIDMDRINEVLGPVFGKPNNTP